MAAVVHVITALERGGAQRIAIELAAGLHSDARPALLLAGRGGELDGEARTRLRSRFSLLRHLRNPLSAAGDVAALVELHRALLQLRRTHGAPLFVHTHSSKAGILGRLAASAVPGAVVVHTVHGFGTAALGTRARPFLELAERVAGAATDALVFVCDGDLRRADEDKLAPRARRFVIPGFAAVTAGLPSDADRARTRARFGVPEDAKLAVTIANLKPQKDPLFHAEILAAWRERQEDARLLLLGDGPLRGALNDAVRKRGLDDALIAPGFQSDPRAALDAADVYLLASRWEGLPMSVLEALARGLPVVARDTGWVGDIDMPDRITALPGDAPARAYVGAIEDAISRGRQATTLPERFTLPGMLAATEGLYAELTKTRSSP